MKFLKIFLILLCSLSAIVASAQDKGSGVIYFSTVAQMNSFTPNPATDAEIAIVTSGSLVATIYTYDRVGTQWTEQESITVDDTAQIALDITNGVLTATLAQNGASSGQYYTWNGTAWVAKGIEANEIAVTDAGGNYTATDIENVLAEIAGQLHDAVTLAAGSSSALTISAQELGLNESILETNLGVDDLKTLSGVAGGSADLGTFTGNIIGDNQTIKEALQDLETANNNAVSVGATQYYDDAAAGAGGINAGEFYELALSNRYGGVGGTIRRRQ